MLGWSRERERERERESFELVRECAKIVRRKLSRINQNLCVFLQLWLLYWVSRRRYFCNFELEPNSQLLLFNLVGFCVLQRRWVLLGWSFFSCFLVLQLWRSGAWLWNLIVDVLIVLCFFFLGCWWSSWFVFPCVLRMGVGNSKKKKFLWVFLFLFCLLLQSSVWFLFLYFKIFLLGIVNQMSDNLIFLGS